MHYLIIQSHGFEAWDAIPALLQWSCIDTSA